MNISEVMQKLKEAGGANEVFKKRFLFYMKCTDSDTSDVFYDHYHRSEKIYGFSEEEQSKFDRFSVQYTCYLLSNYSLRGMSATVKGCSLEEVKAFMFSKNPDGETYVNQNLFKNIAVDGYFELGIKEFIWDSANLANILKNPGFFHTHSATAADQLKQLLFLLHEMNAKAADDVADAWKDYSKSEKTEQSDGANAVEDALDWRTYIGYDWIGVIIEELGTRGTVYKALNGYVENACGKERKETVKIHGGCGAGGYATDYTDTRTYTYYGEAVGAWLKRTAQQKGFYSGKEPAYLGTSAPSGCVKKGTKILMGDGSQKNVEEIQHRDEIQNCRDMISYASKEMVRNPFVRSLYAVNGDEPFLSLEHPILTKRGWCSLNPALSMEINPEFEVKLLQVGDVFQKAVYDGGQWKIIDVTVETIHRQDLAENVMCYDLCFYDGYRSYYANGYPCLCNYPQITVQTLLDGMEQMEEGDRRAALLLFAENGDIMEKLIGRNAWETLSMELRREKHEME